MTPGKNVGSILFIDDEKNFLEIFKAYFTKEDYKVHIASSAKDGLKILQQNEDIELVVTDYQMPDMNGMELFYKLRETQPDIPVILLTAYGSIDQAVEALKSGIFYYFKKPVDFLKIKIIIKETIEKIRLKKEVTELRESLFKILQRDNFIGKSPKMKELFSLIDAVAETDATILIQGETGTGKELVARTIHSRSLRSNKPFLSISCAAIPAELLESELFGRERGAYTGAHSSQPGRFERAHTGTLFLDEIGELPLPLQSKILRILQDKRMERLGGTKLIDVDVRIIAATNRELQEEVDKGNFRKDLFYRLNVIPIRVPPMRERVDDIPLLAYHFLDNFTKKHKKHITGFTQKALDCFKNYQWPGNVREIENLIERLIVISKGNRISFKDLPPEIQIEEELLPDIPKDEVNLLSKTEKQLIEKTIQRTQKTSGKWNKAKCARILGISRKLLYKKLQEYGISED
ncbi:sigma-54 dependent transcriptional regulator [bacterium]|nr:sigma-54 dependent transcriptional regulator [bacterium]